MASLSIEDFFSPSKQEEYREAIFIQSKLYIHYSGGLWNEQSCVLLEDSHTIYTKSKSGYFLI